MPIGSFATVNQSARSLNRDIEFALVDSSPSLTVLNQVISKGCILFAPWGQRCLFLHMPVSSTARENRMRFLRLCGLSTTSPYGKGRFFFSLLGRRHTNASPC